MFILCTNERNEMFTLCRVQYSNDIIINVLPVSIFMQLIPQITSLPFYTTIVPLVFVLAVTAIKDAVDDFVS